ncbi:MAG: ribbon-helix-helix protein, CopG family [Propionibacteriaceae bacterium]|jgi:Arc/MetJ-type ribon-helix-helix transcriptional regulator|nr:ribbon-helix-helix protein, CopG family [Propionibacteriaceae bacterium]
MAMTLRLPDALEEDLRERARVTRRSQASLIEEALQQLLAREPQREARLPEPAIPYREMPLLRVENGISSQSVLDELRAERLA